MGEYELKSVVSIMSLIAACFVDIVFMLALLCVLLLFDNILGVYSAYKFRRSKKWFVHGKLRKTLEKFTSYSIALIVAWILQQIAGIEYGIIKGVAVYIGVYEGCSIMAHLSKITGLDVFSILMEVIKDKLDIKKYFKSKQNEK